MYVCKWSHCYNGNLGSKGYTGAPGNPGIPGDHGIRGPRGLIGKMTLHGYTMQSHICLQQLCSYHLNHQTLCS